MDTPKKKLVRCLGPGEEHLFFSADPSRNRICRRCEATVKRNSYSDRVLKDPRTAGGIMRRKLK